MDTSIEFSYTVHGDRANPAVLFLHGFLGSRRDWDAVAAALADAYCCVAVDLPGHGATAVPDDPSSFGMPRVCEALVDFVDELDFNTYSVVGYSMGGRVALYLAVYHSMRIDALVLESASPGLRDEAERRARRAQDDRVARDLLSMDFEAFLRQWYDQDLFASLRDDPTGVEALIQRRLENDPARLAFALRALGTGTQPPLWDELRRHTIPTLLIVGERDAKFRAIADEMASACPSMTPAVVPGCGHNVHWEEPAAYTTRLRRFLDENGETRHGSR